MDAGGTARQTPLVNEEKKLSKAFRSIRMTPVLTGLVAASLLATSFVAGYAAGSIDVSERDKHERKAKKKDCKKGDKDEKRKKSKKGKRERREESVRYDAAVPTASNMLATSSDAPADNAIDEPVRPGQELRFTGACDASGAVPIDRNTFALVDDEDNILRVYDARRGGPPLRELDLSPQIPQKPEADFESATRAGDDAYFLSSHGRSKKGAIKEERLVFFSTNIPAAGQLLRVIGEPYNGLVQALVKDVRFAPFGLQAAAQLAPNVEGGLNIEGMTATPKGSLLIGFRNPIPQQRALLVELLNPAQVPWGDEPKFSAPITLPLEGRGVRALSWWHGEYLIVAGPLDAGPSQLYRWGGPGKEPRPLALDLGGLNPEAFFTPEERDEFLIISDDGTELVGSEPCKKLKDANLKGFRARWVRFDAEGTQ